MSKIIDLTGQKFGRLTVIKFACIKNHCSYFLCRCDCGNEKVIRGSHLKQGTIKSCGCLSKENSIKQARKMGLKYGKIYGRKLGLKYGNKNSKYIAVKKYPNLLYDKTFKRLNKTYNHMIARCYNSKSISYKNYGARGIKICNEWKNDFMNFYNWAINNGYKDNLTIDRIDNNGNYEPSNCRWVDNFIQARNKRNCIYITYKCETKCLSEWAEIYNINYAVLYARLFKLHWNVEKALNIP